MNAGVKLMRAEFGEIAAVLSRLPPTEGRVLPRADMQRRLDQTTRAGAVAFAR